MTNQRYADALDSLMFSRMHDNYFANEIRSARREEDVSHLAACIADEVVFADNERRKAYSEEIIDDGIALLLRDLLDDLKAGINPTETLRRSVRNWATGVAECEIERGEV